MAARQEVRLNAEEQADTKRTGSRYTFAEPTRSIIGVRTTQVQVQSAGSDEKCYHSSRQRVKHRVFPQLASDLAVSSTLRTCGILARIPR